MPYIHRVQRLLHNAFEKVVRSGPSRGRVLHGRLGCLDLRAPHVIRTATILLLCGITAIGIANLATGSDPSVQGPEREPHLGPVASPTCSPVAPGSRENYRLPAPRDLPEGVSFATDWKQFRNGGWFGVQAVDNCRMVLDDGFRTWHGMETVRVEVQPADDPLALRTNTERAEVLIMQDVKGNQIKESAKSGTVYYATSYYFPQNWQGQQLPWSAFSGINCAGDDNRCNSWSFVWQFWGWGGLGAAQTSRGGPQQYQFNGVPFVNGGQIALDKWTDFVFSVDWNSGYYKIWRRDEGGAFTLALVGITPVPAGKEFYVKQGLYRGGAVGGRTDVLWIGPTARGGSFAAVEQQAFGTTEGIKHK